MYATSKRSMKIIGNGSTNGGSYHHVRVMGEAQIVGSLDSDSLRSMGTLDVSGSLKAGRYRQIGEAVVHGDLVGNHVHVLGELHISGSLRSRSVKVRGQLDIQGQCEAERFEASGGFGIQGLLNAGVVDIRPWGHCSAKGIRGGNIVVRQSKWDGLKQLFGGSGATTLTAEVIQGELVYLENTIADVVRGTQVTIGPGCRIGRVEYRKQLRRIGDGRIGEEMKQT